MSLAGTKIFSHLTRTRFFPTRAIFHSIRQISSTANFNNSKFKLRPQPILDKISQTNSPDLSHTVIVSGMHLLTTEIPFVKKLVQWGGKPFIVGKPYSNNKLAIDEFEKMGVYIQKNSTQTKLGRFTNFYTADIVSMWKEVEKYINSLALDEREKLRIMILDDGGILFDNIPDLIRELNIPVVGKEQTASGGSSASDTSQCPIVEVFSSAVKSWFEPTWIAQKSLSELEKKSATLNLGLSTNSIIGIVGLGRVGMEALMQFIKSGYKKFIVCDLDSYKKKEALIFAKKHHDVKIEPISNAELIINGADFIIGCTGTDFLDTNNGKAFDALRMIRGKKVFASFSSRDTEFNFLLRYIQGYDRSKAYSPLADISFKNGFEAPIYILRGGTPINFTNEPECVPSDQIQLIRALELIAVKQADAILRLKIKNPVNYKIDAAEQYEALRAWAKYCSKEDLDAITAKIPGFFNESIAGSVIQAINEASGNGATLSNNAHKESVAP